MSTPLNLGIALCVMQTQNRPFTLYCNTGEGNGEKRTYHVSQKMLTFGAPQLYLPAKIGGVCFRVSLLCITEKKKKKMSLEEA